MKIEMMKLLVASALALTPALSFGFELKDLDGGYKLIPGTEQFQANGNCQNVRTTCPEALGIHASESFGTPVIYLEKVDGQSSVSQSSLALGERGVWHYYNAKEIGTITGQKFTVETYRERTLRKDQLVLTRSLELTNETDGSNNLVFQQIHGEGICALSCEYKKQ